jgi:hypothetical protein
LIKINGLPVISQVIARFKISSETNAISSGNALASMTFSTLGRGFS